MQHFCRALDEKASLALFFGEAKFTRRPELRRHFVPLIFCIPKQELMLKLGRSTRGHFVKLIKIVVHLITCILSEFQSSVVKPKQK